MLQVPCFACGVERSLDPQKIAFPEIVINIDDFLGCVDSHYNQETQYVGRTDLLGRARSVYEFEGFGEHHDNHPESQSA